MRTAGARALREDDHHSISEREAVLSAWEQKLLIDESPLRTRRFQRENSPEGEGEHSARSEPDGLALSEVVPLPQRRTVTITGQPGPARGSRRELAQRQITAQPDRVAFWAFVLGLFLVAVAAATANAAPL
jgi:hypothetical protein